MIDRMTTDFLDRAKAGSAEALNHLFDRVAGRLLAFIRMRMGRNLRAQMESRDILQVSLMKAFAGIDGLKGSDAASLMSWLARIAENEIRDQADYHGRQRRNADCNIPLEKTGVGVLADRIRSQASQVILDDEMKRLERAMEAMDKTYREIILLRKFEELSFKEIGTRLDKSPDACRMLLARAMTAVTLKLRELT